MNSLPLFAAVLHSLLISTPATNVTLSRQERHVIYPMGGQFKLVITIAVPVKLGLKQSMAWGINLQFQFAVPTSLDPIRVYPPIISRKSRDAPEQPLIRDEKAAVYNGLELIMERYGLVGRPCLLQNICQNAMEPVHHELNGLYGHILHLLLTPNCECSRESSVYCDALKAGKYGVDCSSLYPSCPGGDGILDLITILDL